MIVRTSVSLLRLLISATPHHINREGPPGAGMQDADDPQRSDEDEWDYKEVTIPLDVREGVTDKHSRAQVDGIIAEHLNEQRRDGWQPDESVELSSLRSRNRVRFKFRWFQGPIYISVV